MIVGRDELERLGLLMAEQERFLEYVAEQGIDPDAAGEFCGGLAAAGVRSLGLDPEVHAALGAAMTTCAVCAFEVALRAREVANV